MTTAYEFEPTVLCEILHDLPRHFRASREFDPTLKSYKTGIATLAFLYSSCLLVMYMIVLIVNVLLKAYKTPKLSTYEVPFILKICVCLWCGPVLLGLISECFVHQAIKNSFQVEEDPLLADIRNNIQETKVHLDKATVLLRDFYMVARDYRKYFSDNYCFGYIDIVRGRIQSYEKVFPLHVLNTTLFEDVEDNESLRFFYIICAWIVLLLAGVLAASTMIFGSAAAGEFIVGVGALWSLIGCVFGAGIVLAIAITTADACINPSEGFLRAVDQSVVYGINLHQFACRVRSAGDAKNTEYVTQLRKDIKKVYQLLISFNYHLSLAYEDNFKLFYMMENVLYEIKQAEINIEYFRGGPFKPCKNDSYLMEQISRPVCVQGLNSIAIQFTMLNLCAAISFFILLKYSGLRRVRLGDKNLRELLLSLCLVPPKTSECMTSVCKETNMRSKFDIIRKYQKPVHKKKIATEKKASNKVFKKIWPLRKAKDAERFEVKKMWFLRKYKHKSNVELNKCEQTETEKKQGAEQFNMNKIWLLRKCKPRSQEKNKKSKHKETENEVEKIWFLRRFDHTLKEEKNKENNDVPAITNPDADETFLLANISSKYVPKVKGKQSGSQEAGLTAIWPQGLQLGQSQPNFFPSAQPLQFLGHEKKSQNHIQQKRPELLKQKKCFGKQKPETTKLEAGYEKTVSDFKEVHSGYNFQPRPYNSNILATVPHSLQNLEDPLQTTGGYRLIRPRANSVFYKQRENGLYKKVGYEYSSITGTKLNETRFQKNKIGQDFKHPRTGMSLPSSFEIPGIGFQPVRSRLRQPTSLGQHSGVTQQPTFILKQLRGGLQQRGVLQQTEVLKQPAVLQQPKQPGIFTQSGIGTQQSRVGLFQPEVEQQSRIIQQQGFTFQQQKGGLQKTRVVQQPQQGLLQQSKSVQIKNELEQQRNSFQESVSATEQKLADLQPTKHYKVIVQKTEDNLVPEDVSREMEIGETDFKIPNIFFPELGKGIQLEKNGVQKTKIDKNGSEQPRDSFIQTKSEKIQLQQSKTDVKNEHTDVHSQRERDLSQISKHDAQQNKIIVTDSVQIQKSKKKTDIDLQESVDLVIPELDTTETIKNKTADCIQQIENKTEKCIKIESDVFQRSDNKEFHADKEKPDNTKKQANTSRAEPEKIGAVFQKAEKTENIITITNLQRFGGVCCPDEEISENAKKQVNIDISKPEPKNIGAGSQIAEQQKNISTSKTEYENSGAVSQISKKQKNIKISNSESKIGVDSEIAEKQENIITSENDTSNDTKEKENINTSKPEPENIGAKIPKNHNKNKTNKFETKNIGAVFQMAKNKENFDISKSEPKNISAYSQIEKKQENLDKRKSEAKKISADSQIEKQQEFDDASKSEPENIGADSQIPRKQENIDKSKSGTEKISADSQIKKKQENIGADSQIAKKQEFFDASKSEPENIGADSQILKKQENIDKSKSETEKISADSQIKKKQENIGADSQIAKKQKNLDKSKFEAEKISTDSQIEKKEESVDSSKVEPKNSSADSQVAKKQEIEPTSCNKSVPIKNAQCICMSPKALKQTHGPGQQKGGIKKSWGGLLAKFTSKSSSKPRTCCFSGSHICEQPSSKATSIHESCTCCCSRSQMYGVCEKTSSKAKSKPEPRTCCSPGSNMCGICEHPSSKSNKCCVTGANMYGTCKQPSWLKCLKTNKDAKSGTNKMQRDMQNMDMQGIGMQNMYTQGMGRRITGTQQMGMPNIGMQGTRIPGMGMQGMGTQQRFSQDRGMQQISMQDLGMQQMDMQDMAMQRMSMQDMGMQQMGMQDVGMHRMSMQDMGMQQMGLQDTEIQQMGMQDMGMQQMGMQESGLQQMELQDMGMQQMDMQDFGMQNMNLQDYSTDINENMQYYDTQYDASTFSTQEDFGEMSNYLNENIVYNEPTCEHGRLNPGSCIPEECVPGSGLPGSCPPGTCLPETEQDTSYNIEQDSYYPHTEMTDMRVGDAYSGEIPMTEYAPNMMIPERRLSNMEEIGRQMELGRAAEWGEMENAEIGMQGVGMEQTGLEGMGIREMEMGRMETGGGFGMSQTRMSGMAMVQEGMTGKGAFGVMTGRRQESGTLEMQQFHDAELQRQRMSQIDLAKKRYFLELTKHNKMCKAGRLNPGTCYPGFCVPGSGQPGSCMPAPDMKKIKMCKAGLANPGSCYPGFCMPGSGKPGSCMPTTNQKSVLGNRMADDINASQIRLSQTLPMDNASYNTGMPNMNMANMNIQNLDTENANMTNMNMVNTDMENMAYMNMTNTDMTGIDTNIPYMNMSNTNMGNMDTGNMNMPNTNMANVDMGNMNMPYMNMPNTNMDNMEMQNMNMGYMNMPNNDLPYYSNMVDMPNTGYSYYQQPSELPQMPSALPQMPPQLPQMPPQLPQMPSELPGPSQAMYSELKDTDTVKAEPERSNRLPSLMNYSGAPRMFPQQDDSCCDTGPNNTFCLEEEDRHKFKKEKKACFDQEKGVCHERQTRPCSEEERRDDDEQEEIEEQMKKKSSSRSNSPKPCTTCKPKKKPPTRKYC